MSASFSLAAFFQIVAPMAMFAIGLATLSPLPGEHSVAWAQGSPATSMVIQPCERRCSITAVVEAQYGDDAGQGMIESEIYGLLQDPRHFYLAGRDHVLVFGRGTGRILERVGQRGEGPGEMLTISSMAMVDDGVFVVVDRGRGVLLKLDWTGRLLQEVRLRSWIPKGLGLVPMGGALAVYEADIRSLDQVGYPLHLVSMEDGEVISSFGSLTGEYDPDRDRDLMLNIARGPDQSVWAARVYAYRIERWQADNRLLLSMRRELPWFPDALVDRTDLHLVPMRDREPEAALVGLAADDSLLWIMIQRSDQNWREASEYDEEARLDTFVEVVDWKRGRVVASQRFDEVYHPFIEPGVAGQLLITPEGSVRFQVSRFQLDIDGGAGGLTGTWPGGRGELDSRIERSADCRDN